MAFVSAGRGGMAIRALGRKHASAPLAFNRLTRPLLAEGRPAPMWRHLRMISVAQRPAGSPGGLVWAAGYTGAAGYGRRPVGFAASHRRTTEAWLTTRALGKEGHSSSSSANSPESLSSAYGGRNGAVIAASIAGFITYMWNRRQVEGSALVDGSLKGSNGATYVPRPGEDFEHPYNQISTFKRIIFKWTRYLYLAALFLPCAAVGIVAHVMDSESWRERFIEMLVHTFEKAGCSFQKFGQWISMRPDMFPADVVEAMSQLQSDAPEHTFEHTRRVIQESFGAEIEDLFEEFDEQAIASGTVAQVHRARVKQDKADEINLVSRDVAVKVRHPSVLDDTFVDVDVIFDVLRATDWLGIMTVPFSKESFLGALQKQINFEWEAHALSRFAQNFESEMLDGMVAFPQVVAELLSPSVLVESWASGDTIANMMTQVGEGFKTMVDVADDTITRQRQVLAERLFNVCMKMFLRDNLMHGDLHAGNVLFREDGSVTLLDAGHTTTLDKEHRRPFGRFMKALCNGDAEVIADSLIVFNENGPSSVDRERLVQDVEKTCKRWIRDDGLGHDGRAVCVGDVMGEILFKLSSHNVRLAGDVAISLVSIAISEGLIRQLDPEFDMNMRALPFLAKYSAGAA